MASNGWYDADGNWHDPEDPNDPPPGRIDDPDAPGGYTIPAPGPAPAPNPPPPDTPPPTTPPPTTPPPTTEPPPPSAQFNQTFHAPSQRPLPPVPEFTPPPYTPPPAFSYADYAAPQPFSYADYAAPQPFSYADFKAPSGDEALNDPGYRFRAQQGEEALQRWAAANGTLNDSGTAHALMDYGQNAATQEYANVWNRDWNAYGTNRQNAAEAYNTNEANRFKTYQTDQGNAFNAYNVNEANRASTYNTNRAGAVDAYNTNYHTQFLDPYSIAFQGATASFAPKMTAYQTEAAWNQNANTQDYTNAWQQFLNAEDMWKFNTLNKQNLAAS